ncbi:MAG: phosphopentomutase [Clostridiales Family XIII bacterium]|nr:phosphopentomutase [Clostridiales Family XIII bacterium]
MNRVTLIVLDSLGVGALPDAADYGDEGCNTLAHILSAVPGIRIPHLRRLGLCAIEGVRPDVRNGIPDDPGIRAADAEYAGVYGRVSEASKGKDTVTGHWEIAGIVTDTPFRTFARFPDAFMRAFEKAIGTGTLGNCSASGTEIIEELGPEHERTGQPIVYTSNDSVFQIAANTDVIPPERLFAICETARAMLTGPMLVGRVIARPYIIENGKRIRTPDRRDYAVPPPGKTLLDNIADAGLDVVAIGKIHDIFAGRGVTLSLHTDSNEDGAEKTIARMRRPGKGLIFVNLVDFDSKYGHRRDPAGYARALERFDAYLPRITAQLQTGELLILCADHGNDPTHGGFDHTREYIPLIVYGKNVSANHNLGTRTCFADIGATIAEALGVAPTSAGTSFLPEILKGR